MGEKEQVLLSEPGRNSRAAGGSRRYISSGKLLRPAFHDLYVDTLQRTTYVLWASFGSA